MDSSSSAMRCESSRKGAATRRSWTPDEEQVLLQALKDLVTQGWKCDNGFRSGYQGMLQQSMLQAFPDTSIRVNPHINSKLHVWKKDYGSISTMLSRSGFGWNDSANTIEVETDEIWNEYVKTDPNAKTMRYKSWPYYPAWCEIFGKDRATGENAQVYVDLVNDMLNKDHANFENTPSPLIEESPHVTTPLDAHSDYHAETNGTDKSEPSKRSKVSKKRKSVDTSMNDFFSLMSTFCEKTDSRLAELVACIRLEQDAKSGRQKIFDSLQQMHFLSTEDKIYVATKLSGMKHELDVFFSLDEENKSVMVKMLRDGRL